MITNIMYLCITPFELKNKYTAIYLTHPTNRSKIEHIRVETLDLDK